MKDTLTDANFPRTADNRVYHLGLRPGEVANRIITVGSPSRARSIAAHLDPDPALFELASERGFLTLTGRYKDVPVSIISIGMGSPNMDFFVREVRECVVGDMAIVRLGSCGALLDVPVGTVVVPKACVAITRNVDFDFLNPEANEEPAYRVSKPAAADPVLQDKVYKALEEAKPVDSTTLILPGVVNASADSFYSSQGRQTSFPDSNADLIENLRSSTQDLATLEMETFHLYHLAACWSGRPTPNKPVSPPPLTTGPVNPTFTQQQSKKVLHPVQLGSGSVIRAAAAQMVFAARGSGAFITPEQVAELERWTGLGVLEALKNTDIALDRLKDEKGLIWEYF